LWLQLWFVTPERFPSRATIPLGINLNLAWASCLLTLPPQYKKDEFSAPKWLCD